ncbi:MAG: T9SS type A sorting domain-containing protein [Bacteroidetes bacterium]|nr:T9SS type A sorting domain-containing protein [Bacteroidota bacterium]
MYPNPANAIINLTWNNNLNSDFTFIVFDIMGKQLLSKTVKSNSPDNILSIPVDQLPAGVYQIAIYSGNAIKTLKFIKS